MKSRFCAFQTNLTVFLHKTDRPIDFRSLRGRRVFSLLLPILFCVCSVPFTGPDITQTVHTERLRLRRPSTIDAPLYHLKKIQARQLTNCLM